MADLQPEINSGMSELDLMDEQGLVNRVVEAVERDDLRECWYWIRRLEERSKGAEINSGHSDTSITPLLAACTKDPSRTRSFIIRILACKGAKIPVQDATTSSWMELIRPEQIELAEGGGKMEGEDEENIKKLLALSEAEADEWIMANLPPPQEHEQLSVEGAEPGIDPYDEAMRASSMPADFKGFASLGADDSGHVASSPPPPHLPFSPLRPHGFKKESPTSARTAAPLAPSASGSNVIDLTDDRSPSPIPKEEDPDSAGMAAPSARPTYRTSASGSKRHRSRSPSSARERRARPRSRSPTAVEEEERAHIRLDSLPAKITSGALDDHFSSLSLSGIVTVLIQDNDPAKVWALVTFSSLALAQQAYITLQASELQGRKLELKIYSAQGEPVEPFREVRAGQASGGRAGTGGAGGITGYGGVYGDGGYRRNGPLPPQGESGPALNNNYGRGGGGGGYGPPPGHDGQQRYFPRPRPPPPPIIFTAAELARRVYCGSLRCGTTQEEVQDLFSQRAGVVAKVLKVMNAQDGSHAFAFVQLPDAITADHALKTLHGTVHDGHLLQLAGANELGHRWLFSISLHNLPLRWPYRDVSDFLVSVIGNFAGLIVRRSYYDERLEVRVELRYATEVKWSCSELNGLIVDGKAIEAVIDQHHIRRQYELEMSYKRLQDNQNQQQMNGAAQAYDPNNPQATAAYNSQFPSLNGNGGGATPAGGRRVPPPPPPAATGGSTSPMVASTAMDASQAASTTVGEQEQEYNPFAPAFMLRK
ncbi:hypothetical protein JCM11251_000397 [Rhodosporidiobolus azoricus]